MGCQCAITVQVTVQVTVRVTMRVTVQVTVHVNHRLLHALPQSRALGGLSEMNLASCSIAHEANKYKLQAFLRRLVFHCA
jgi:hypothetical protein